MTSLIGQSLGRYKILEQLGEGGMATVYKAFDTGLERNVAVKIIRLGAFPPEQLDRILQRFDREAKALARLSHPKIVGVLDYGDYEGSPYLVMEFLPGGTLKHLMGKPMPWQVAVHLVLPIVQALQYAHEHNIVHRNIKPSNILLTENGQQPMLSDFSISKILEDEENANQTVTGMGIGTPEYMAPEQWIGQGGPQSDLYSLGVVLYDLVTGRSPYTANTPAAILLKQANEPLPSPGQFAPGLPGAVEKVLLKALAKDLANRFQNMGEFSAALEGLLIGDAGQVQRVDIPSQVAPRKVVSFPEDEQTLVLKKTDEDDFYKTLIFKQEKQHEQPAVIPPPAVNPPPEPRPASRRWISWAIWGGLAIILLAGILLGIGYLINRSNNQTAQDYTPTPVVAFLGQPSGTLASWDRSFNWTGVAGATEYLLEIESSAGTSVYVESYNAEDICTGMTCSVTPAGLTLPNGGSYKWRLQDYGAYVYGDAIGAYSDFQNFTLAMPLPVPIPGLPSDAVTADYRIYLPLVFR